MTNILSSDPVITGTDDPDIILHQAIDPTGSSTITGGAGDDALYGDHAGAIIDDSAANATPATALDLDDPTFWSVWPNGALQDETLPTATVLGTGADGFDYFTVTLGAGAMMILDVDHGDTGGNINSDSFDSYIQGYVAESAEGGIALGERVFENDDQSSRFSLSGDYGSVDRRDSYVEYINRSDADQRLVIELSDLHYGALRQGKSYVLNVSVAGHDHVARTVSATQDNLFGGAGRDQLFGGDGADRLEGGDGYDTLLGGAGADTLLGGAERDLLRGEDGDDHLSGGEDYDRLYGGAGDDQLAGGGGRDDLYGEADHDTLSGGAGDDRLEGAGGNDLLSGGDGSDNLYGGTGHDTMEGGRGNDDLFGGTGHDSLLGGDGRDFLSGGGGDDWLYGGQRNDRLNGGDGDDILIGRWGFDILNGADGDDHLDGGNTFDALIGGRGDDTLDGGAGDDTLDGGGASRSNYWASRESFQRYVFFEDDGDDFLDGGSGSDRLNGNAGQDTLIGGTGDDTLRGDPGQDRLNGGQGQDVMDGGAGWDLLFGGSGADDLYGGSGHDTLIGGADDDRLAGGSGRDVFVFTEDWGADVIDDFDDYDGEKIAFAASTGITDFDDLIANHLRAVDGAAEIHAGAQTIRLSGVGLEDIGADRAYSADDFVFFTLTQDLIDQWL